MKFALYLSIAVWFVLGIGVGRAWAANDHYDWCLKGWVEMSYAVKPHPLDNWPGQSECHLRVWQSHGSWVKFVPDTPPMPDHYINQREWL